MSKELKHFIDEHRREFDDEQPSPRSWNRIEQSIHSTNKKISFIQRSSFRWMAAASFLLLTALGYYLVSINKQKPSPDLAISTPEKVSDLGILAPEYAVLAEKIHQSIEIQQQQLKAISDKLPSLYLQFSADLGTLDSTYNSLKERALKSPGREEIVQAMLQNLQLQSSLLEKQLQIIHEFNNRKNNKDEKNIHQPL